MRYIYVDIDQNRVVCIHKQRSKDHFGYFSEYIVSDDFDMSKEITTESGEIITVNNCLTAQEFLERFNNDYVQKRISEYPRIEDQLDKIYHEGLDAWKAEIAAIKNKYPKPE
jgi:hypothetical protein